jgi:CHAT domain-containing protein
VSRSIRFSNKQIRQFNKTALFGGLDYYSTPYNVDSVCITERWKSNPNLNASTRSVIDVDRSEVGQLEGSKEEVLKILQLLPDGNVVETFFDQKGTEEAFKTLSGKDVDLLHISTHGYYLPKSKFYNTKRPLQIKQNTISFEDESLIRSGLYFAGSNAFLLRKELLNYFEDGIATASEIAKLNFQDLDLVVLSACETGLGDLEGDGVYGLQRGFKKAGARSLLMSLQKVNDYATRLLMVEFYKNYFRGRSKRDSLNRAQNYVKHFKDNDGNDVFSDPSYWASFVLLDAIDDK